MDCRATEQSGVHISIRARNIFSLSGANSNFCSMSTGVEIFAAMGYKAAMIGN
jgi:hypothetical protein